jgi:hypothetical protein
MGAAAFELATVVLAVFVAVDEGLEEGVPDTVALLCSSGIMMASKTCMRPL